MGPGLKPGLSIAGQARLALLSHFLGGRGCQTYNADPAFRLSSSMGLGARQGSTSAAFRRVRTASGVTLVASATPRRGTRVADCGHFGPRGTRTDPVLVFPGPNQRLRRGGDLLITTVRYK